jgi:hypothetical protein
MKNKTISNSFAFVKRAIAFIAAVCIFTTGAAPAVHATPPSYPTGQPPEIHTIPQIFENFVVEWSFNPTDIASSDFYTVWNASVAGVTDWIVEKAASLYTESGTLIAEYNNAESQFVFKVPIKFEQPVSIDTAQDLEVGGKVGIGISDAPSGLLDILGGEPSYLSLPTLQTAGPGDATYDTSQYTVWYNEGTGTFAIKGKDNAGAVIEQAVGTGESDKIRDTDNDTKILTDLSGDGSQDVIQFDTAGATAMVIDDDGQVGIGDSSPDGTLLLDVNGQIGATEYCEEDGSNCHSIADFLSETSQWDNVVGGINYASGNVGIGTNTPSEKLDVSGGSIIANTPVNPRVIATEDTSSFAFGVAIAGRYAYVADHTAGLQVIDISDPSDPITIATEDTSGYAYGVAIAGRYAYVADYDAGLQVIDISDPSDPVTIATEDTSGFALGVAIAGRYAYVGDHSAGLQVIDISDPSDPVTIATENTSGFANSVAIAGRYAYVADNAAGLQVIDISDPSDPVTIATEDTSGLAYGVAIAGRYAYVADFDAGLQVIDISDPSDPVTIATEPTSSFAVGVAIAGRYAYVADNAAGLQVIDISDPSDPVTIATEDTSGLAYGVAIAGRYAYVGDYSAGLQVIDINGSEFSSLYAGQVGATNADIEEDLIVGNNLNVDGAAQVGSDALIGGGLAVRGKATSSSTEETDGGTTLTTKDYVDAQVSGLESDTIKDADDDTKVQVEEDGADEDKIRFDTAGTERMIIDESGNVGIGTNTPSEKLDVSGGSIIANTPVNPRVIATEDTSGTAYGVAIAGRYAYVADGNAGLQVIDISDPSDPITIATEDTSGTAWSVAIASRYAYVTDGNAGLQVIDISDPSDPITIATEDTSDYARSVAIAGRYAYVADFDAGLQVIDISDPSDPVTIATEPTSGSAVGVAIAGRYAYVADGSAGLQVIDISDPSDPITIATEDTSSSAVGVAIAGRYAYVADNTAGLQVIDISDPSDPITIATEDTSGFALGVAIAGRYAYVGDHSAGLQVINISDPSNPVTIATENTSGIAYGVAIAGRYAYVADNAAGLQVIDINGSEFSSLYAGQVGATNADIEENIIVGNNLNVDGAAQVGSDALIGGGLAVRGKATSSSTEETDGGTTLTTKDYVDGLVSSGAIADGDKGDITVSGSATVWTIDDDVIEEANINAFNAAGEGKILSYDTTNGLTWIDQDGSGSTTFTGLTDTPADYTGADGYAVVVDETGGQLVYNDISGYADSAVWGNITGTLSNQTDLQNALNAKLDLAGGTMTGDINTNGNELYGLPAIPSGDTAAASKKYVDDEIKSGIEGLSWRNPVDDADGPTGGLGGYGTCDATKEGWATFNKAEAVVYTCSEESPGVYAWTNIGATAVIPNLNGEVTGDMTSNIVADNVIDSANIINETIVSEDIDDGTIATADLADDAITSGKIDDGTIVDADVNAAAAIAGTKISPDFGSQNVSTTGDLAINTNTLFVDSSTGQIGIGTTSPEKLLHLKTATGTNAEINIQSGEEAKWGIYHDESTEELRFWNTDNRLSITPTGNISISGKATSASTLVGDGGTTLTTKDYVDAQVGGTDTFEELTDTPTGYGNNGYLVQTNGTNALTFMDPSVFYDNTDSQDLSLAGNTLSLTGDATPVNLSGYLDNTDNQDIANVLGEGNNTGGTTITGLPAPSADSDAANKKYVDDEVSAAVEGLSWKEPVDDADGPTGGLGGYGTCDATKEGWATFNKAEAFVYTCSEESPGVYAWTNIGATAVIPNLNGEVTGDMTSNIVADNVIDSANIINETIVSEDIDDGTIATVDLADDAITSGKIDDGTIVDADVNAAAAIAGTKISPDFGSQNVSTTGDLAINTNTLFVDSSTGQIGIGTTSPEKLLHLKTATGTNAEINIQSGEEAKWGIYHDESTEELRFWNTDNRLSITPTGNISISGKATSASTLVGDGGTTLTTKDYVDAQVGETDTFKELIDTPTGYGNNGYLVQTNGTDALTFMDPSVFYDNTDSQDLSLAGNTLSLTGDATPVNLSGYLDNTDNQDIANVLGEGNNTGGTTITGLPAPSADSDAANKKYVDDEVSAAVEGLSWKEPVDDADGPTGGLGGYGTCDATKEGWATFNKAEAFVYTCSEESPGVYAWTNIGATAVIPNLNGEVTGDMTSNIVADNVIDSANIINETIVSEDIDDGTIATVDLADDAITSGKIDDGTIVDADVNAAAAIAGTKISPDFGSQNVSTTGDLAINTNTLFVDSSTGQIGIGTTSPEKLLHLKTATGTNAEINIQSGEEAKWGIYHDESTEELRFWNTDNRLSITPTGNISISGKATSASTLVGDGGTTLTTKDYVDAQVGETDTFKELIDTPTGYGNNGYLVQTNGTDALTFMDPSVFYDNTDSQDLSLAGNTLSLTGDATPVNLSGYLDNTDSQDLSLAGNTLSLTGDATPVNLSGYLDNTDNQDIANVLGEGNNTGGTTITGLPAPSADSDAANKKYVDDEVSAAVEGLSWKEPVDDADGPTGGLGGYGTCDATKEGWATFNKAEAFVYTCSEESPGVYAWTNIGATAVIPNLNGEVTGDMTSNIVADNVIDSANIINETIVSEDIDDGTIATVDLADDAITSGKIDDGTIVDADVNAAAAIAGTKISPDFGSQNVSTTGDLAINTNTLFVDSSTGQIGIGTTSPEKLLHLKTATGTNAEINIQSGEEAKWGIYHDESTEELRFWNTDNRLSITPTGNISISGKATSASTLVGDGGTTLTTKDYVDAQVGGTDTFEELTDTPTGYGNNGYLVQTNGTNALTFMDPSVFYDNTDSQDLSLAGNTLSLTGDATPVNLSGYLDNTDSQDLSLAGNTLSLTGDATPVNLSGYLDNTDNQDIANVLGEGNNTGGTTITGLPTPSADSDAANKKYVDDEVSAAVEGLSWKEPVDDADGPTGGLGGYGTCDATKEGWATFNKAEAVVYTCSEESPGVYAWTNIGATAVIPNLNGEVTGDMTSNIVADNVIDSANIINETIVSEDIDDGTIATVDLADDAITSGKIDDGTIVDADVNAAAAIAGTKISPDFGSQNVSTTGDLAINTNTLFVDSSTGQIGIGTTSPEKLLHLKTATGTNAEINIQSGEEAKWGIYHDESTEELRFWNTDNRLSITPTGNISIAGKATSASTLVGDGGTTLTTKDYVDAQVGGTDTFEELTDTPTGYGNNGYLVQTNGTDALTFMDPSVFYDNTDSQDLSLAGNTLSLTGDATPVNLSGYLDNTDSQDLSLAGNTLSLTGDATPVNLSGYLDNTDLKTSVLPEIPFRLREMRPRWVFR